MSGPDVVRPRWETPYRATRLLLASTLGHLLPSIARTAEALDLRVQVAGGLLHVVDDGDGRQVSLLFHRLAHQLTDAETEAVRVATDPPSDGPEFAARLLTAPTLAVELARRGVTVEIGLLADAELWPVYQPIVALDTGRVVAHEALLRGRVDGAEVGGGDLFFLAEAAGWLPRLDRVAREAAIAGAADWLGAADLYVNFSPAAVFRPAVDLAGTQRLADRAGLEPGQLVFEVVAEHALADRGHLLSVLEHHRSLGWRVALDDVGVGWSSLALVSSVRPDVVKLGRELVTRLAEPGPQAVARALTESAHAQGAVVVAEGVEDEAMADRARALGVDLGQGWWFGRPARPQPDTEPELSTV
ncbi:EAL domain-containing protein [Modestobacter sp. NPDC049651]|uniref:EAL domain-containing protein n=1 Tax=unclassified Modestobacter TaxID=2643866 RepID=UPI0033DE6ADE